VAYKTDGFEEKRKMIGRSIRASLALLGLNSIKAAVICNKEESFVRKAYIGRVKDIRLALRILTEKVPGFEKAFGLCISYFSEEENGKNEQ
jgi:hypothetical protein